MMYLSGLALMFCAIATVAIFAGLLGRQTYIKGLAIFCMVIVFFLVSVILAESLLSEELLYSMRSWYLLPLVWFMILLTFISYLWIKQDMLFLIVTPLSFVILFTYYIFPSEYKYLDMTLSGPIFWVHLSLVFLGFGLMALAACVSFFFLLQERTLKKKLKLSSLPKGLPSIMSLDKINAVSTALGFPIYLLGVLSGFSWAYISWGEIFSGDPKEIISLIILVLYAYLFYQRVTKQSYGRRPALWSIFIFVSSLLSIIVVNTMLPTHHSFIGSKSINTEGRINFNNEIVLSHVMDTNVSMKFNDAVISSYTGQNFSVCLLNNNFNNPNILSI